jgi:lipoprotein NlpI
MKSGISGLILLVLLNLTSVCYATNLCCDYVERQDYDKAIDECTKQIKNDWDNAVAYNNRGVAYKAKGRFDQAIYDYNKAIELSSGYANAYNNRGAAYYSKGNFNQAISDYSKAIELNPEYANAYNNRGVAYYSKGNFNQAISDYNKTIELNPKHINAYCNRGLAQKAKGNYDQAISDYFTTMSLDQDNEYVYIDAIITSIHISHDMYKKALKRLKHYIRWHNSEEWPRIISNYYLGVGGLTEKDVLSAASRSEKRQEREERLCEAYYYIGEKRLMEGNRQGAKECFMKSVEMNVYNFIEYANSSLILTMMADGKI